MGAMLTTSAMLRVHRLAEDVAAAAASGVDPGVLSWLVADLRAAVTNLAAAARAERRDIPGVRS